MWREDTADRDVVTFVDLPPLMGAIGACRSLAMTPDGKQVLGASDDAVMRMWNLETGEVVATFEDFHGPIFAAAISPDGITVCGAGGIFQQRKWLAGEVFVYDLQTRERIHSYLLSDVVMGAEYSSNDELVTGGADRQLSVWNLKTGTLHESINAHADTVRDLQMIPGQRRIASASEDNATRIWDLEAPTPHRRLTEPQLAEILDLSFSPDGNLLASASGDKGVRLWDTRTGEFVALLGRHNNFAHGVTFSPDGLYLASMGTQWPNIGDTDIKIWDLATKQCETHVLDGMGYGRSVAWSPNGEHLVVPGTKKMALWNVAESRIENTVTCKRDNGFHAAFSQDGKLIVCVAGVWKYPSMEQVFEIDDSELNFAVDIHPDNQTIAIGDVKEFDVVILSAADGREIRRLKGHQDIIMHLHFSHDGRRLASTSQSGMAIIWNLETGNEIVRCRDHQSWVWSGLFSPDDRMFATGQGGLHAMITSIYLRRTVTKQAARALLQPKQIK